MATRRGEKTKRTEIETRKIEARVSLTHLLDFVAVSAFGSLAEKLATSFRLDEGIRKAGMNIQPKVYMARILTYMMLSTLTFTIIVLYSILFRTPLAVMITGLLGAIVSPLIIFAYGITYPSMVASKRAEEVEKEFPFFVAYLTSMAYAGVAPEKVFSRIADVGAFKALRKEARMIIRDVKIFAKDILTAIERNAVWHPSRLYRDFILGYVTTVRTGGDIVHYLEIRTQEVFVSRMEDLRNRADRVGFVVEAYAAVSVLATIAFYIFFMISGLIGGGGSLGGIMGIIIYSFVVLPLISIVILAMLDSLLPSYGVTREPYVYLLVSVPAGILFFLTSRTFLSPSLVGEIDIGYVKGLALSAGLALLIVSIIPGVVYAKRTRVEKNIARNLPAFFRDLSEIRRTGLSPEKSIIMLAEKKYGELTKILKRLAGALAMGLHVEIAAKKAVKGYTNWILRVTMRFLVDAIDVGGGSPFTIDSLARFISTLSEIIEVMKKKLRPYIIMPYFGAVLVAVTSIFTLAIMVDAVRAAGFTGETTTTIRYGGAQLNLSPENIQQLLLIASLASLFNGWLSGLIAGKIQDQSLGAGFVHATILTIIVLLAIIVALSAASGIMA